MDDHHTDTATMLAASRTHLANERTFAAWLRTGLSVAAAGIAVARIPGREPSWASLALGLTVIFLGSTSSWRCSPSSSR
jgi:putative membrane protein